MDCPTDVRFDLKLRTVTGLHVGTGEEGPFANRPFRRRADGELVIPGTTIAGVLRSTAERLTGRWWGTSRCWILEGTPRRTRGDEDRPACECPVCKLFGDVGVGEEGEGSASRVVVRDAVLTGGGSDWTRIRDGVGVDRERWAASAGTLYTTEVIPRGREFRLTVEVRRSTEDERALVARSLEELATGRTTLGLGSARGWGRVRADRNRSSVRLRNWDESDDLVRIVTRSGQASWREDDLDLATAAEGFEEAGRLAGFDAARVRLRLEFDLELPAGQTLLVDDPMASALLGPDSVQLGVGSADPDPGDVVLPGSTVRGVVRSQAERILRTMGAGPVCSPFDEEQCVESLTDERESERVCMACDLFGWTDRASRMSLWVEEPVGAFHVQPFDHVTVDRFTGGAREGKRFDEWAIAGSPGEESPLRFPTRIDLDPLPFPGQPHEEAGAVSVRDNLSSELGLLLLTLRDFRDGLATFGSGGAGGHGRLVPREPRLALVTGDRDRSAGLERVSDALGLDPERWEEKTDPSPGQGWESEVTLDPDEPPMNEMVTALHDRVREGNGR